MIRAIRFTRPLKALIATAAIAAGLLTTIGGQHTASAGAPDLRTTYIGEVLSTPTYAVYQFSVKNVGTATASMVVASGKGQEGWYQNNWGWILGVSVTGHFGGITTSSPTSQSIGPLQPGQSTTVMMVLVKAGNHNSTDGFYFVTLTAATPGDANPADNTAGF